MPQPSVIESPPWLYNLTRVSEDKSGARPAIPPDRAVEVIGADMNVAGGLRLHPGMKRIIDLSGTMGVTTQTLSGFFPVTFRVDATQYGWGFVYRAVNTIGQCKYFFEWRVGSSLTWYGPLDLVGTKTNGSRQMHVVVHGRFVYVFVEGSEPFFFYVPAATPGTPVVVTNTGPGPVPPLENASPQGIAAQEDAPGYLDALAPPGGGEDANSRLIHFVFNDPAFPGADIYLQSDALGAPTGGTLMEGPSDTTLWDLATPPQPDPTFNGYSAGYKASLVGAVSDSEAPVPLAVGSYTVGYQLYDSTTGRTGQLTTLSMGWSGGPPYTNSLVGGDAFVLTSVTPFSGYAVTFPAIDITYDGTRYDSLIVYRSIRGSSVLRRESVITLDDYKVDATTASDPNFTPSGVWKRAVYFLRLDDGALALKDVYQAGDTFDEEMPSAGSAIYYEGTMFVGKMGTLETSNGGLGEIRWSDPYSISPELFRPSSQYVLQTPGEEIERFCNMGQHIMAFTRLSQYVVRKYVTDVKVDRISVGYGVVGPRAACEVGNTVYFLTPNGLQLLYNTGELSDIAVFNDVIQNEWAAYDLSRVQMAYDAVAKTVICHNPLLPRGQTLLLWLRTSAASELWDGNWSHVTEGDVPRSMDTVGSPLERRACFVQEIETSSKVYRWRVMVMDVRREKTFTGRMMDWQGRVSRFSLASTISGSPTSITDTSFSTATLIEGCRLYVLDGVAAGRSVRIKYKSAADTVVLDSSETAAFFANGKSDGTNGLDAGTRLGISPVYFRWTGGMLGMVAETGEMLGPNYFRQRHISGAGCSFTDVRDLVSLTLTPELQNDLRYAVLVFEGTSPTPSSRGYPVQTNREKVASLVDGPSVSYGFAGVGDDASTQRYGIDGAVLFPSIEVAVPDVDFRLLGVRVLGTIVGSDRPSIPRTN